MTSYFYLGSYAKYISQWGYNSSDRKLTYVASHPSGDGPSWLVTTPDKLYLYAAVEMEGMVESYSIEKGGQLKKTSAAFTCGDYPCFISVDPVGGKYILVANYGKGGQGVLASFPVEDGSFGTPTLLVHNPPRGKESHIHCAEIFQNYVAVVDLGLDTVSQYALTPGVGIAAADMSPVSVITFPIGSGPRHIKFHPTLPIAVTILELSNEVVLLPFDRQTGLLKAPSSFANSSYSTLRANESAENMTASAVVVTPSFVYASNRDRTVERTKYPRTHRSSVAIFQIVSNGNDEYKLQLLQHVAAGGDFPRHIDLINGGTELLLMNQEDSNFVSYTVDSSTGLVQEDSAVVSTDPALYKPTHNIFV